MQASKVLRYAPYVSISIFIFVVVLVLLSFDSIDFPKPETREITDEPIVRVDSDVIQETIRKDHTSHQKIVEQPQSQGPFMTSSIDLGNETEV